MTRTLQLSTLRSLSGLALLLTVCTVQAQVYRNVGPDGKVTFSDQPPVSAPDTKGAAPTTTGGASGGSLPYELRQTADRYPVVLYTGDDCAPCNSARNLLQQRGIPFTERTVTTREDSEALKRISGDTSLPVGTIGSQRLKGFSDVEWTQYLDAAGYPKTSQLPSNYRNGSPSPLVAVQPAEQPRQAVKTQDSRPAPAPIQGNIAPRTGTGGIQF